MQRTLRLGVFYTDEDTREPKQQLDEILKPGDDNFTRFICHVVGENYSERRYLYESVRLREVFKQYALIAAESYYKR